MFLFWGTLFWSSESKTIQLGTLQKGYGMSLQIRYLPKAPEPVELGGDKRLGRTRQLRPKQAEVTSAAGVVLHAPKSIIITPSVPFKGGPL